MRTLFGLIPFYGGEDSPMDQMVKSTLATVGSNNIDVRDQEGNTLLILACQHSCEVCEVNKRSYSIVREILVGGMSAMRPSLLS